MVDRQVHCSRCFVILAAALFLALPSCTLAQPHRAGTVDLRFDRFYNYAEMTQALKDLAASYPDHLTLESIGHSSEGRDMWMMTINNAKTGSDRDKPAMYIDANVHGNEVQGSEVCLYTISFLMKNYGHIAKITELVDTRAFYVLPSVNPDGRSHWFDNPNTSSSSRTGKKPTDNDYDGLYDEDGYDDLDGDGWITSMWQPDPNGRYRRSNKDPRIFKRVPRNEKGDYTRLGSEGIDNDGDGRINEDGPGGYDMNRNWPSGWRPNYVQYGAGEYPFSYPETACIGEFILDHPNIAAVQSYHNAGGMILRGPGAEDREDYYPRSDVAVYNEIAKTGERILPNYRSMTIWEDLYTVHGGFVNWTSEGLGIFSFTNELWTRAQYYYGKEGDWPREEQRLKFGDLLQFGELWVSLKPYNHPTHGEVLIGGWNQYASRVPPTFMLEELCHRNFAFTMYHADQMPQLSFSRVQVKALDAGVWEVTAEVTNTAAIPSISAIAAARKIGARDKMSLSATDGGTARVLTSGTLSDWLSRSMTLTERQPEHIWVEGGVASHGQRFFRWIVEGAGPLELEYKSQKGGTIRKAAALEPTEPE